MFSNCHRVRNKLPCLELILSSIIYDIVMLIVDIDITINLFADDTKLSLIYNNVNDRDKLQLTINTFYNWSVLWQLENSAKKSFSLTLGKVTIPIYYVNDARISYCYSYIDLGITIDDNLYFKKRIGVYCAKAYNVINRIFRCFITNNVTLLLQY